jgi:hypothetical protein
MQIFKIHQFEKLKICNLKEKKLYIHSFVHSTYILYNDIKLI